MSENVLPPRIKFYQNHLPTMDTGEYTITVNGSISHAKISADNTAAATQHVAVYGERYTLNDQDFKAVFPLPGSTGEYSSILPHVILNRITLPWERHAIRADEDSPWLALLLFDEDQAPPKTVVSVKDLYSNAAGAGFFPAPAKEVAQHDNDKLTVIDVPKNVLDKVLPSVKSLQLMAHTRQGVDASGNLVGEENAVVFCNRLPEQGKRSTMHLVSVEDRYTGDGFDFTGGSNLFRLVSLKSWEFYTLEHFKITTDVLEALKDDLSKTDADKLSTLLDREFAGTEALFLKEVKDATGLDLTSVKPKFIGKARFNKTFDGLLLKLNKDLLTLRLPDSPDAEANRFLSQGMTPMLHYFRNGDQSVSWYRGPFLPYAPAPNANGPAVRNLQPETADELLQFNAGLGMFDATYAAAWEMGRLLALSSKDFSVSLFQWKRLIAQHQHKVRQTSAHNHLPMFAHTHNHEAETPLWERHLQPWLDELASFQRIPANYLLPDERLLPKESIRFFYVDKNWQIAALIGAFSIGGDWDAERQTDDNAFNDYLDLDDSYKMGFLLRSDVVDGWPGILIDGYDTDDDHQLTDAHRATPLRRLLSRNVLLCLFKKEVKKVVFHQKPEVMHFGLTELNGAFSKRKRNNDGLELDESVSVKMQDRAIDLQDLANKLLDNQSSPAKFAMNMIEGVPRVIFNLP